MQNKLQPLIIFLLIVTWVSHLIQVFTPEMGFDAVWYHLPVIRAVIEAGNLVYLPELYQSLNPLLSDLVFGVGFVLAGELGAKMVAYLFGLGLVTATYIFARQLMTRFWSLVTVLIMSTFQVVAWQSASFYVDVAKAMWEVLAVWSLITWRQTQQTKNLWLSAFLLGASLATKQFSLFLIPLYLLLVWWWSQKQRLKNLLIYLFLALVLPFPFYLFSFQQTGDPLFSMTHHLADLGRIGAGISLSSHAWQRTLEITQLPAQLVFALDYTSILLIIFWPVLIWYSWKLRHSPLWLGLVLFVLWQLEVWWYLPPLSTRYALSGFIVWTVLSLTAISHLTRKNQYYLKPIMATIIFSVVVSLVPRFYVNFRSYKYLSGQQTKTEYLRQFLDGNIDRHLKKWHQLK